MFINTDPSPSMTTTRRSGWDERDSKSDRRREPHGVLEVEEVGPVAERVQLDRDGAHDRDDRAVSMSS